MTIELLSLLADHLAAPDLQDLPPRRHTLKQEGDPTRFRVFPRLANAFAQYRLLAREDGISDQWRVVPW